MIAYTMFGTKDLQKATAFYDELFKELGYVRTWSNDNFNVWGAEGTMGSFAACKPENGEEATVGNGTMIAIGAPSKEVVEKVYAKALELGGTSEGEPGYRADPEAKFYAAYFRDLDGNKMNCVCVGQ